MRRKAPAIAPAASQDYLASVSDLMSGLIFIFIITLAVFALRLARAQEETEKSRKQLTDSQEVRSRLVQRIGDALTREGLRVEIDTVSGVVRLTEQVIGFERGKAEPMQPENVEIIHRVLTSVLPCYVASPGPLAHSSCDEGASRSRIDTVMIEGHADRTQLFGGKYRDNLGLSAARSSEIFRILDEVGRARQENLLDLKNSSGNRVLSVSGYGDLRPIDQRDPNSPRNRRIDIRFIMELPDNGLAPTAADSGVPN